VAREVLGIKAAHVIEPLAGDASPNPEDGLCSHDVAEQQRLHPTRHRDHVRPPHPTKRPSGAPDDGHLDPAVLEPLGGAREPLDVEQVGVGDVVGGGGAAEGPTAQVSDATRPLPMPRQPWVAGC
jgi:hypothetical protein